MTQFIEKIKQIATGKSAVERQQERAAMDIIRRKALAAQLKERETQAIRFAAEREKVAYEKRTKQLRAPKQGFFSGASMNYGNMFGQPRQMAAVSPAKRYKTTYIKKGKRYIKRRVAVKPTMQQAPVQQTARFDILGSGLGTSKKYDVLGI